MNILTFNIETVADPALPSTMMPPIPTLDDIKPHAGIKDPAKQEEFKKKALAAAMETAEAEIAEFGIFPLTGKTICLAYQDLSTNEPVQCFSGDDERKIMEVFQALLSQKNYPVLLGYNSKNFDLPHIAISCIRNSVKVSGHFDYLRRLRKYQTDTHIDLYEILTNFYNNRKGKLSDWCTRFGITPPFGVGSMVSEWHQKGDWESIEHHCSDNVRCTTELFLKIKGVIL